MVLNSTLNELAEYKEVNSDSWSNFFKYILWTIKFNYKLLPGIVIVRTFYNLLTNIEPILQGFIWGKFIDALINKDVENIGRILIIFLLFLSISSLLGLINDRIDTYGKLVSGYKYRLFFSQKFASLGIDKLEDSIIANQIYRLNNSYSDIWGMTQKLSTLVSSTISVFIALSIVLNINWVFVLIIFFVVSIRAYVHSKELKEDWKFSVKNTENKRIADGHMQKILEINSLKESIITNSFNFFYNKYKNFYAWYYSIIGKLRLRKGLLDGLFEIVLLIILGLLIKTFIKDYIAGIITVGNITFYIFSFRSYISSLKNMLAFITAVSEAKEKIKDAYTISNLEVEIDDKDSIVGSSLDISFENVNFTYPNGKQEVIKDLNLVIKKGEKVAIVGENGAGKTTLMNLLLGFYKLSSGEIRIGDIGINEINKSSLYSNIGMLMQSFNNYDFLSIEKNITLGNRDGERLDKVVKDFDVKDIIKSTKFGLKQILGPWYTNGVSLSGGQWQKIAIARTIFRNTPIIILDEPTSALDPISEAKIFEKLYEEFKSKTVITISHRFSTVKKADRIIVLSKGQIVEQGSHKELMDIEGVYAKAYRLQADSYKD